MQLRWTDLDQKDGAFVLNTALNVNQRIYCGPSCGIWLGGRVNYFSPDTLCSGLWFCLLVWWIKLWLLYSHPWFVLLCTEERMIDWVMLNVTIYKWKLKYMSNKDCIRIWKTNVFFLAKICFHIKLMLARRFWTFFL